MKLLQNSNTTNHLKKVALKKISKMLKGLSSSHDKKKVFKSSKNSGKKPKCFFGQIFRFLKAPVKFAKMYFAGNDQQKALNRPIELQNLIFPGFEGLAVPNIMTLKPKNG